MIYLVVEKIYRWRRSSIYNRSLDSTKINSFKV